MDTKQDFLDVAFADIDNYPRLAALYRAGDPRITQHLGAMAAMLAHMSAQQEVAAMEPFMKERPATIIADAAMRGIIPRSKGVRLRLSVNNAKGLQTLNLQASRKVLDSSGNEYQLESPVAVPAGGQGTVVAQQITIETIKHTVVDSHPFYAIEVPMANDGSTLSGIAVSDSEGEYSWSDRYTNIKSNERVFHVECDDQQRTYVRFGYRDVVGFQPPSGTVITLQVSSTRGDVTPDAGSPFTLDYANNPLEAGAELAMLELVQRGENPVDVSTLKELARYPSTYSNNAVFLGNFDYLVRSGFPSLQFGSVWNEAHEELVRGADVKNINALFVAVVGAEGLEEYLTEVDAAVPPLLIDEAELTDLQRAIRKAIHRADDGYRIKFYTPVVREIGMTITARVSSSYLASDVEARIKEVLLKEFGKESASAKRGYNRPLYQQVYKLVRDNIPALSGGDTDLIVNIVEPPVSERPELWRYVSHNSLKVKVNTVNTVIPSWGG